MIDDPFFVALCMAARGERHAARAEILSVYLEAPAADRDNLFLRLVGDLLLRVDMVRRLEDRVQAASQAAAPKKGDWIRHSPEAGKSAIGRPTASFRVSSPIGEGVRLMAEASNRDSLDLHLNAPQARELGQQLIAFAGPERTPIASAHPMTGPSVHIFPQDDR